MSRAILHIDGDAFFASCEQARDPSLRGKPVITGKERGIAASMSYEAKARGVTRAMPLTQIRRLCPDAVILPSDYETYSLLSKRFFDIVRRWTPDVEEYSIDECFADLTGLRRQWHASYRTIAARITERLAAELGFTFSAGLAPSKVLAKVGSKWNKPNGLTVIPSRGITPFLADLPTGKVWGIGPNTEALLAKHRIFTAAQFARMPLSWVKSALTKPHIEIWHELNGVSVMPVTTAVTGPKYSIQKFRTFTPPSRERAFVFAQLSRNVENACIKARRHGMAARDVLFILRSQNFSHRAVEVRLTAPTAMAHHVLTAAREAFPGLFQEGTAWRATGAVLLNLVPDDARQPDLFGAHIAVDRMRRVYRGLDALDAKYGKHTVWLGSSHPAQVRERHAGERGDIPARQMTALRGESARRRLAIPMLMGSSEEASPLPSGTVAG